MTDEYWMKRVLNLAKKGAGRTSPNPMVGAILLRDGTIVGSGYHARAGEAHAEIAALQKAGTQAKGATLYINLEPCVHQGRTPPCAPALIEAGISRAVIGMIDPNPLVNGKGIEALRNAGIEVRVGVLEKDCRRLNEAFCKYITTKRPFVILKAAVTLDGKIATRDGESKWISAEASRRLVHRLRNQIDAVLVGIGTVLRDDPLLTARLPGARNPYRIVLDSRLRIPEEARVFGNDPERVIVATTEAAPAEKILKLRDRGVKVLLLNRREGRLDLDEFLKQIGEIGITSLLVEGGSTVNGSFFDGGFIDKLMLFISPRILGDARAPGIFGGNGIDLLSRAPFLRDMRVREIGGDILVEGYLGGEGSQCLQES